MNKTILLGRLTKDPEVKYLPSGKAAASFTLAINRPYKSQDGSQETDFLPCVMFGKSAEQFGNTVGKGQRTLVEGRIQVRSYKDKAGVTKYITEIICDRFEYIERKSDSGMQDLGQPMPFDEEIPFM